MAFARCRPGPKACAEVGGETPEVELNQKIEHMKDHVTFGDSGLSDLLLHECDHAFTIPSFLDWENGCGFQIVNPTAPAMLTIPEDVKDAIPEV